MNTAMTPGLKSLRSRVQADDSLFFFSSRRRHTRCSRDWSSDVCSSDLQCVTYQLITNCYLSPELFSLAPSSLLLLPAWVGRSEERRVGKECRSRWSPYH